MRRLLLTLVLILVPGTVWAQPYTANEQITVANASIGLTSATINNVSGHPGSNQAICSLQTAAVRFRVDGIAPTTTVGLLMNAGDVVTLTGNDILNRFRAIRTTGTSGVMDCAYSSDFVAGAPAITLTSSGGGAGGSDATAANQTTMITALQIMDDWDESDRVKVNPIVGQAGVAAGAGVNGATVIRTTEATDSQLATDIAAMKSDIADLLTRIATDPTHGNTLSATGPQMVCEAKTLDGSALPNVVTEGQPVRMTCTLAGIPFSFLTNADGTKALGKDEDSIAGSADHGLPVLSRRIDAPAPSSGASGDYGTFDTNANGALWVSQVDPCSSELVKTTTPISLTADTVIVAAVASKKNYICSMTLVASAAEIISITEGTGTVCGTDEVALVGSTTDANGMSFAANSGPVIVAGSATAIAGKTANSDTCLNVSGSNRVSGFVTWVQR